ncbi:MAG TPA: MFS transporter [Bacteroidales bacterium]|jgi:dipeptide/tripeptide permease|nr:MFS transporter [Bacteroidales bacterium]MBP7035426.1 MFS transporter [Bacteroidales bacterium]MBP8708865.1 MFS transporter [Bacteroidales bacterium]MZQ79420.1 MFS transporter [Bacteroidales bacterium]HNV66179.1 MFS transporter [Bacteroidales bacterium]
MSSFIQSLKKFPRLFWISNIIELFERWGWYAFYNGFIAIYLTSPRETGALGFSNVEKGTIMGTASMILYFLPVITGAVADRVGYKKVLITSFITYVISFFMLSRFETFGSIFAAFILLAVAGALFKPLISGTVARVTDRETASLGFGIFYMVINIGGFIGPFVASLLYKNNWDSVFYMSIAAMTLNLLLTIFFYREPAITESGKSFIKNIGIAFRNIGITLTDWRFLLFLLIIGVFWTAYNQLYYSFPVFLESWVNLDGMSLFLGLKPGTITTVTISSLASFFIILFQLIISSITARFRPLNSIMTGIFILAFGLGMMFANLNPWIIVLGVLVFSIGEMASSPKIQEYLGGIAPSDRKALYMGTAFLPIALGHVGAGWISGRPFEVRADKLFLLKKAVEEKGFDIPDISGSFTQTDYFNRAQELFGMDSHQLTRYLWDTYNPSRVWILFTAIAIAASVMLYLYDRLILKGREAAGNNRSAAGSQQ